jgi:hypothetical protein
MKLQPVKMLVRLLRRVPGRAGAAASAVAKADKHIDRVADLGRRRRAELMERIRRASAPCAVLFLLALTPFGCVSARQLRSEGCEVSCMQRMELGFWDALLWLDGCKDAVRDWMPFGQPEENGQVIDQ